MKTKTLLTEKTLYELLKEIAFDSPDKRFLFTEEKSYTRMETLLAIRCLISQLKDGGVKKGSIVGLRTTRSINTVLLIFALNAIGAVTVLADPHFKTLEFIRNSGSKVDAEYVITNEDSYMDISAGEKFVLKTSKFSETLLNFSVSTNYDVVSLEKEIATVSSRDPSAIIFTSGSTGKSKAVLLCQYNYINNAVDSFGLFDQKEGDISIATLPFQHIFGLAVVVEAVISRQQVFIPKNTESSYVLSCIEKYKINRMYGVPTYYLSLATNESLKSYDISSFKFGLVSAGPTSSRQFELIESALGIRTCTGYGMSENQGITLCPYDMPFEKKANGVGHFYPNVNGKIIDENGNEVKTGETGEICVKSYALMLGYYNDPEETSKVIDKDGWLHTGDIGYIDIENILHLTGRKKDIIIRGGENLSAAKIENALLSLPEIFQAAVVGIKDERYGEVPAAIVVLKAELSIDNIKLKLAEKLSKHEIPEKILLSTALPLTSNGKTDKLKIIEMLT